MKQEQYNRILHDAQCYNGLSIKCLSYLEEKYPSISPHALESILSSHIQNQMKMNYSQYKTEEGKDFLYKKYLERKQNGESAGVIVRIAQELNITPALIGKQILTKYVEIQIENGRESEEEAGVMNLVRKYLQDYTKIRDSLLSLEIFMANLYDNMHGPIHEVIRGSIGHEYEIRLYKELKQIGIPYRDENYLRKLGYDKTPDVKLEIPIAVDNFIIHWIESKARFGDVSVHKEYIKNQYASYWNRFGPGLVIYWFGFIDELESEEERRFIIRDHLPRSIVTLQSLLNIDKERQDVI